MYENLISLTDAAKEFSSYLTKRRLQTLRAERRIPSYKVSGRVYFTRGDLASLPLLSPARIAS
jgi:hypothetical protein